MEDLKKIFVQMMGFQMESQQKKRRKTFSVVTRK